MRSAIFGSANMSVEVNGFSCPSSILRRCCRPASDLLSRLTGDPVLAAKWVGVIMNTVAVGLAMMVIRQLFPTRPVLAWFTGLGLAINHVWCRLAPFALTENLFYPLLMGYFLVLLRLRQNPTWWRGLALGILWGALYLSREIGLFIGALGFLAWLGRISAGKTDGLGQIYQDCHLGESFFTFIFNSVCNSGYLDVLVLRLSGNSFTGRGTTILCQPIPVNLIANRSRPIQDIADGEFAFFRLHPYELMEYTRFPTTGRSTLSPRHGLADVCPSHYPGCFGVG